MYSKSLREIAQRMAESEEFLLFTLGDSITQGALSSSAEHTYTACLARGFGKKMPEKTVLRYDGRQVDELLPVGDFGEAIAVQQGTKGKLTVVRCGIGGNTVRRLLNRKGDYAGRAFEGRKGDLFTVNLGINDSLRKDPAKYVTVEQYKKDLCELIDLLAQTNPEADVILMTPTYHHDGSTPHSDLTPYADAMKEVAVEREISLIDLHRKWMEHMVVGGELYGQGDWLKSDKCHPSDVGHAKMAEQIIEELFPR